MKSTANKSSTAPAIGDLDIVSVKRWIREMCRRGFWAMAIALLLCGAVTKVSATPPPGYYLVWSDEFNGTSLNPAKWSIWDQPDQGGLLVPDAISVGGGYLTITTYTSNNVQYTGIISSRGLFLSCYGYYESSVEFNGAAGTWSAFWLNSPTTGLYDGNPAMSGAEVDICEHRNYDLGDVDYINGNVQTSVHWDNYTIDEKTATSGLIGSGLGTGFHTYGFQWVPGNYNFTIDGATSWTDTAGMSARTEVITLSSEVLNGGWAGNFPANGYGNLGVSTTTMVVDYFRYYAPTNMIFWTGASTANWGDAGSWLAYGPPNGSNDVIFSQLDAGSNLDVSLPQNSAVNSLWLEEESPVSINDYALTVNAGGINMVSSLDDATINSGVVLGTNQNWTIGQYLALIVNGPVSGPGNLTLAWLGTVVLAGANTCSGITTVSNGTLQVTGSMTNAIVAAGGTLSGTGVLAGPVSVMAGGTISPGPGLAPLTINNTLALQAGGAAAMNVNAATDGAAEITGLTAVTYGGTLVLNNQSGAFVSGNTFKLFNASSYSGAFAAISPAVPATGLVWETNTLAVDGTLRVGYGFNPVTTLVLESRFGSSTDGTDNPAFSFNGFSSVISANKSTAPGCTSPGSSRFTTTASPSTSFSVTPNLLPGTTYTVSVSWGYISSPYGESSSIVVKPTATGVASTTFPATTAVFSSGSGDATNNTWETVGNITPSQSNPVITFTYVSGLAAGRWYADAVRFISQPSAFLQPPQMNASGIFSFTVSGNPGAIYGIQSSTDLVVWNPMLTVSNATGSFQIIVDNSSASAGACFYRTVILPP
jgi:autotransporter-associated beta strand protein